VDAADPDQRRRVRRISWAVALSFLLIVPMSCFYARAWRRGALWLGLFIPPFALRAADAAWGYRMVQVAETSVLDYGDYLLLIAIAAKLADLFIGVLLIALRRRERAPLATIAPAPAR
jgi:hypothetical protein